MNLGFCPFPPVFSGFLRLSRKLVGVSETAYLSLGSNLGDRAATLRAAVAQLEVAGRVLAVSALYETQPMDGPDQPWFLNCVAAIETGKSPRELLQLALQIEAAMGRLRLRDKGARKIDIDVVLFGDCGGRRARLEDSASRHAPAAVCSGTASRDCSGGAPSRARKNCARTSGGVGRRANGPAPLRERGLSRVARTFLSACRHHPKAQVRKI